MSYVYRLALGLIMLGNLLGLSLLFGDQKQLRALYPDIPGWLPVIFGFLCLLALAACAILWTWRIWGFYLLAMIFALMLVFNLLYSASGLHTAMGPLSLIVLGLASWPVRSRFGTHTDADGSG